MGELSETLPVAGVLGAYDAGATTPREWVAALHERIERAPDRGVWIHRCSARELDAYARRVERRGRDTQPLYGVPFAIKDNIDLAGAPTSCACPEFAYRPAESAAVVQRLIDAGAIPIGKTNLDQFATGLVGTRSPYGVCRNAIDSEVIAGGSSSGSAVAVASGLVSFALGTDTAGSGRVPAALGNLIGLKPSRGLLSARGVVPACRTLDCVSIFALCASDASRVFEVARGFDPCDAYSRALPERELPLHGRFRFGVPQPAQLEFFGDGHAEAAFAAARAALERLGGRPCALDIAPLQECARLLYEGPWVAERYAALAEFVEEHAAALHPVTRQILAPAAALRACDAFRAQYRLAELRRAADALYREVDVLAVPSVPAVYRIAEVEADPLRLNARLGTYTNFVNLLDWAAVAAPSVWREDGLPAGVTLIGPRGSDRALLALADRLQRESGCGMGAPRAPLPEDRPQTAGGTAGKGEIRLAVCGAHMEGLPLNAQLVERGGALRLRTRTAPAYRLYALAGGPPERPGLVRDARAGRAIDVEVWSLPAERFGGFAAQIPAPLGIGRVELQGGESVLGFLCESHALETAREITALGGWRAYLRGRAEPGEELPPRPPSR